MASAERFLGKLMKFAGVRTFTTMDIPRSEVGNIEWGSGNGRLVGNRLEIPNGGYQRLKRNDTWYAPKGKNPFWYVISDKLPQEDCAKVENNRDHVYFRIDQTSTTGGSPGRIWNIFPGSRIIFHGRRR